MPLPSGSPMSNQAHQPRKHNRFQNVKNQSPKFYANKSYNNNNNNNNKPNEDHHADSSNAMVPDIRKNNIYTQCLSVDQSLNEFNAENNVLPLNGHENNLLSDSMASCSPTSSSNSSYNDNMKLNNVGDNDDRLVANMHENNQVVYDQQLAQNQFMTCNVPQMPYECDYQQQQQPPASQYYIYHPYQEYGQGLSGSPLNNSFTGTPQPQQQQQQQSTTFYTAYQTIPSYIYDPTVGAYTTQAAAAAAYSPMMSQQSPNTPQQQPSMLASYKTPTQPAHQLYMNITPPSSLSPNDTCVNNSSSTNDRTSDCNSPHPNGGGVVPNTMQTPLSINPYVMYAGAANPYLTPQAYHQCNSPIPTPQYMMYHPPPPLPPQQQQQQQQQMNSSVMHTPQYSSCLPKYNKATNNKYNNGQNKRGHNSNIPRHNSCFEQTPQSSYNLDESMYSPVEAYTEADDSQQTFMNEQGMPVYPTSPYCDPNAMMGMPNSEAILNAGYNYDALNGIESYGDDYDYDDNGNAEDNDENLACQVCRGRRMCFCYFLKVRYYKFPSFFDLVDHQYKKWRATMAKQNQAMLNNNNNNNSSCNNNPNMMMTNSPTAMPLGNITNHNNAKKA